jgi:hypothetical protein
MQGQLLRERTPASGEWQVNALNLWGSRVDGGKGGILGQHSPPAAGALALLGKLSDGSARRDAVRFVIVGVIEALAVGLAVAKIAIVEIAIVEVDGHERLGGPTPGL